MILLEFIEALFTFVLVVTFISAVGLLVLAIDKWGNTTRD